jgi:signal transduction histidine kinase
VRAAASPLSQAKPPSQSQTKVLLWAGFGGLLLLMCVLGLSAVSFLYQIEIRQEGIRRDYVDRSRTLERLRSNLFLSGTYIRDFLLDPNEKLAADHRRQFQQARQNVEISILDYRRLLRSDEREMFGQLQSELNGYFATLATALDWAPEERREKGISFVDEEVLPRRMTAVGLADRIQQVSERQLETGSQEISELFASFRTKLIGFLVLILIIGVAFAAFLLWRLLRLENEAYLRFQQVLDAREELKRLSAEVVSAQEVERRRISRELHDQVGQSLSVTMLGLANLRSALDTGNIAEAVNQLHLIEGMTEENARVVRNMSLLLRPTMLDDLGLVSALRWLAREVSRSGTIQVDVSAEQCPEDLPEEHRTCIFRVVQEAVRNAGRHAAARHVRIYVQLENRIIRVSVQDDGKGFDPQLETGLGILGMHERVQRLGGELNVDSERGRGTIVSFVLPLPEEFDVIDPHEPADQETSPLRTA